MVLVAQPPYESGHHPSPRYNNSRWFFARFPGILLLRAPMCSAFCLTAHDLVRPIIRHKFLILHRINGYVILLLLLLSNAGALVIARRSFGGGMETQTLVGVLAIIITLSAFLAYYNIKRLQIEQHRAWMLRSWFYAGSIITLRLIMIISALLISSYGGYYRAMPCSEIAFLRDSRETFEANFPQCVAVNGTTDGWVAVKANFSGKAQVATALGLNFSMAGWLALFMHAVGVEIYLRLTPRESERLRAVSYQRQLEASFSHPAAPVSPSIDGETLSRGSRRSNRGQDQPGLTGL